MKERPTRCSKRFINNQIIRKMLRINWLLINHLPHLVGLSFKKILLYIYHIAQLSLRSTLLHVTLLSFPQSVSTLSCVIAVVSMTHVREKKNSVNCMAVDQSNSVGKSEVFCTSLIRYSDSIHMEYVVKSLWMYAVKQCKPTLKLIVILRTSRLVYVKHKPGVDVQITAEIKHLHCQLPLIKSKTRILRNLVLHLEVMYTHWHASSPTNCSSSLEFSSYPFFLPTSIFCLALQ
jgi:hypothetical protein